MKTIKRFAAAVAALALAGVVAGCGQRPAATLSDEALMDTVERRTFDYFWSGAEPNSGLARERIHMDGLYPENDETVVTTGGSGFGILALIAGIERGYITREQGVERFERIGLVPRTCRPLPRCMAPLDRGYDGPREALRPQGQRRRSGRNGLSGSGAAGRASVFRAGQRARTGGSPNASTRCGAASSGRGTATGRTSSTGTGAPSTAGRWISPCTGSTSVW